MRVNPYYFILCIISALYIANSSSLFSQNSQVDSLLAQIAQTPDSLAAPLYVELQKAMDVPYDDTTGTAYALKGVKLAEDFADSISLPVALNFLYNKVQATGDSLAADSIWLYRQNIIASFGYAIGNNFPIQTNGLWYENRYQGVMIWTDSIGDMAAEKVLSPEFQSNFILNNTIGDSLDSSYTYWLRMRLRGNNEPRRKALLLPHLPNVQWDSISLYTLDRFGNWDMQLAGQNIPIEEKPTKNWWDIFEVPIASQADFTVFFRLKGFQTGNKPEYLSVAVVKDGFLEEEALERRNLMIFMWVFLFQLLFFGLFYIATLNREYVPYLFYLLGIVLFSITALWFQYLFPKADSFFALMLFVICSWISGLGMLRFSERFLNVKELLPKWKKVSRVFLIVFTAVPVLMLTGVFIDEFILDLGQGFLSSLVNKSIQFYLFLFNIEIVMLVILGVLALRKGSSPALYYLIALAFLLGSVGLIAVIPLFELYFIIAEQRTALIVVLGGVMLQSCFFGLGIGHKRRLLEREKLAAQKTLNEELSKVNSAFGRFVPHTFLKAIGRGSVLDVELGDGVEKEVSVFFSDIRAYTALSEKMTPQENFRFLNSYLGRVGPVITDHEGFVNQYYGDGIMAIFVNNPSDAVSAAIQVQQTLRIYNQERISKGRDPISMGLGLHKGLLMMGVIGDTLRMEAGVVSDTVNTASRMEGLTKHFGCNLVVSGEIIQDPSVENEFQYRLLGKVQVKGRKEPITVFDCFEGDAPEVRKWKQESLETFEQAMDAYYKRDFIQAAKLFDASLLIYPQDVAALKYLANCHEFIANGVPEFWDGIEALQKK